MRKPAARKLKVFRTSIGFHDAYVAAPSRKAALEAWGASNDLFAIGSAELVTDPVLTEEPLKHPGEVIKRSRGGLSEQLAALPKSKDGVRSRLSAQSKPRRSKPKPRPSRQRLDEAEAAIRQFEREAEAEIAALRQREEAIRNERVAIERRHQARAEKLDTQLARTRERFEQAMLKWREDV